MPSQKRVPWTDADQARIDSYALAALKTARESDVDLVHIALGQIQAAGLLIAEDLLQHPERLKFYALAIARLADYVIPSPELMAGTERQH